MYDDFPFLCQVNICKSYTHTNGIIIMITNIFFSMFHCLNKNNVFPTWGWFFFFWQDWFSEEGTYGSPFFDCSYQLLIHLWARSNRAMKFLSIFFINLGIFLGCLILLGLVSGWSQRASFGCLGCGAHVLRCLLSGLNPTHFSVSKN